jgi:hypothetical protein
MADAALRLLMERITGERPANHHTEFRTSVSIAIRESTAG